MRVSKFVDWFSGRITRRRMALGCGVKQGSYEGTSFSASKVGGYSRPRLSQKILFRLSWLWTLLQPKSREIVQMTKNSSDLTYPTE